MAERRYEGGGKWTEIIDSNSNNTDKGRDKVTDGSKTPETGKTKVADNKVSENAEKEFREIEKFALVGDIGMKKAKPKIKAKQTLKLEGFGKIISGLFMVEKVTHRFSNSDGYTQTIGVRRNGFGEHMKKAMVIVKPAPKPEPPRKPPVAPPVKKKTYTVVKGDYLVKIARKYETTWQKLYEANKSVIGSNPNLIYPGQVLTIP
jgi:nucleoid-associated protein YgaU